MKSSASPSPVSQNGGLIKGIAALQLLLAIGRYMMFGQPWTAASTMIALSLAMILFSRERIHDERVEQLKLKAISYGLFGGLLTATLLNLGGEMASSHSFLLKLSTFDGLIIVLAIALALFHYWRWQDGRAIPVD